MTLKFNLGKDKPAEARNRSARFDASAAHLRHLLSAGPVVVYSCATGEGVPLTYISPNVETLMGYKPAEFLAGDGFWAERIHPDDRPRILAAFPTIVDRGSLTLEYRFRHRDGSWRWTLDNQVLIRDETGAPMEIAGAWTDITAQKAAEEALRRQSEFQGIVAGISADLIDAGEGGLDAAIDNALMKVGTFFEADRCYIFRFSPDFETIHNTHEWCAAGVAPQIQALQKFPVREIPWHMEQLRRGGILQIADVAEMPAEAAAEKREFQRQGIRSLIALPMTRQDEFIGFFGLDSVLRQRGWTDNDAALLKVVADIVAGALIRERAAAALADSNRLLDSLVENMPAMVFLKRAEDLRFERFNRAGEQLTGYSRNELLGHSDHDFFPKEQADRFVAADRAVLANDAIHDIREEPIRTAGGEIRQLRTSKIALRDAAGNPTHLLGISVDITEAKRAETALRRSEARLKEAQRIGRLGNWVVDLVAGTIEWSSVNYEIFGRDPQSFRPTLERYYAEIVHPDDADALRAVQEKALATGEKAAIDHRFLRPDGGVGWVHVEGVAEYDESGRASRLLGIVQDVTERKAAEVALKELNAELERRVAERTAALAESQERLERGQRIARLGSWEYDLATSTWQWSDEFFRIFGLDPRKTPITADSWLAAVHPEDRNWVKEALRIGRESHRPQEIQYRIVLPDGRIRVIRARGEEQEGKRVGAVMDVTEQAETERALAEARRIARLGGWEWNARTGARWWSAEMYEILGVDPGFLDTGTEAAVVALIHPDDRARVLQTWERGGAAGSYSHSFRICRPDGGIIVCQERGEHIGEDRWAGSMMDVTDLVRTQEKLAEAQRIAHLGNWESDDGTGALRWSDETYRIFGFTPGAVQPTLAWVESRIHPEDRERVHQIWNLPSTPGETYELQYRIVRPDGDIRAVLEIGEHVAGRDRPETTYVGTVLDVTERARNERSLAEAQRIAKTGSWEHAPERGIERWSAETYRLLGFEPGSVAADSARWRALIHADDRDRVIAAYQALAEQHKPFEIRYRLVRADGERRHVIERGECVDGLCSGTITDITELERTQRSLAEAQRIAKTGSWESLPDREENWWSDELYNLLGLVRGRDASTDATWNVLIHPEDRDAAVEAYLSAHRSHTSYETRYRLIQPSGEMRFMVERGEWADGRFFGTLTDTTDQERTQRSLAAAQRIAKTGSWESLPGQDEEWWSDELYDLLGFVRGRDESSAAAWDALIHPDDREAAVAKFLAAVEGKNSYESRYRLIRLTGDLRFVVERGQWSDGRFIGTLTDITDQEHIQRQLAEAQRMARTGSWDYSPESHVENWSAETYRLLGYDPVAIKATAEAWRARIHPDDRERVLAANQALTERFSPYEMRYRLKRPDGGQRYVIERGEWIDGRCAGTITDITELERTQRNLAEAQRIAKTGSWEFDPDRDSSWWSEEVYRLIGLEPGGVEPNESFWQSLIHPDDRDRALATFSDAAQREAEYEIRYRIVRPSGEVRHIAERAEWNDGRCSGTVSDITESERTQRNLAEAQRIAKTGSWETFPGSDVEWWSDETYRVLGLTPGKDPPRLESLLQLIHPEDYERASAEFEAALARRAGYECRYRIKRPDGETRYVAERGEWTGGRYAGTISDITESERAQRSMAAAQRIALTGSWEYLPDTDSHWWSEEMYRLLGLAPGKAPSADQTWDALIHPLDREQVVANYVSAHEARSNYEIRYRLVRPDGELRFMVERGEWVGGRHIGTLTDITYEEHVKRQLAEAQRIARLGSWEYLPGTDKLRWSEEALRIFGYDDGVAERDTRDWQKRVHPDDLAEVEATLAANRDRGIAFELSYRIVLPGGAVRAIRERIENELGEDGEVIREVGIFQDVTESRQLQLAMRALSSDLIALEGTAYYRAAVERLARLLDVECAIIARRNAAQPGMLRTVALVEDGALAPNMTYSPEGTPCAAAIEGRSVVVRRDVQAEYPSDIYFVDRGIEAYAAEPISDHTGAVIGHVGIMSRRQLADIQTVQTVLRMFAVAIAAAMSREQIQRRDAWLRAILENTPSEIVLKDLDLRIMAASKAFAGVRSIPIAEQIGKSTRDFLPPEIAEIYEAADRKVIATGEPIAQDVVEVENGQTRHIQNIKFPLRDDHGRIIGICSISTDRTEVKRIEAQLAQAQKMEAIGALTGGIAHDFNNYLAVIIGNLEMLKEDLAGDPRSAKLVDAALRGATRSEELTRGLLAFARHQPLVQSIVDVGERIRETAALLERTLGEEITVVLDVAAELSPVLVDDSQLASCLVNLANNARDAMPSGGEVRISAKNVQVDALHGAMSEGVEPGDYVVIEVADTGTGMTPEVLASVFEPFFTTKGPGHGTGLGLSMAYGFVQQSGGQIRIYSEPGFGTNVRIYLPAAAGGAAAADGAAESAAEPMAGHGETILLVEDNDVVRRTTANQLTQLGYRVIEAETGDAAAAILDRRKQTIDLLLTDVVMPGSLDGYALARLACEKRPEVKIVLTSGFVGGQLRKHNQDMPDLPLLAKPCRKAQLARALRSALNGERRSGAKPAPATKTRKSAPRRKR